MKTKVEKKKVRDCVTFSRLNRKRVTDMSFFFLLAARFWAKADDRALLSYNFQRFRMTRLYVYNIRINICIAQYFGKNWILTRMKKNFP